MSFNLSFPKQDSISQDLQIEAGETLFVLGANGTGKSTLMFLFNTQNTGRTRKISAHRQTWMTTDTLDMTPSAKVQTEQYMQDEERNQQSRYRDEYAAQRASMTIYELIDAENVRARAMAGAYDAGDMDKLKQEAMVDAPIMVVNELLRQSNIPIRITIRENERVMASKNNGPEYSAAELSDGERNALLIAGSVLTAKPGTLLIIDEPERHLHRSIILPLLVQLFQRRSDCGFVVSTHDPDLPLGIREARVLLLRSCSFSGQNIQYWEADELRADDPVDDVLKRDLLGARRNILFVEGTESSLDKPLFSVVFPEVSVIPKGDCNEVERAVIGARGTETLHWLRAFGIVDSDGYDEEQIATKRQLGVYALPYYSVEEIYFHPMIIRRIASRQAAITGDDGLRLAEMAISSGVDTIREHIQRLSNKSAKKAVRKRIMEQIPNDDLLLDGQDIVVSNDSIEILTTHSRAMDDAVSSKDWETVLTLCPVRESPALDTISRCLGFIRRRDYQRAVRHMLTEDQETLGFVRSLFGELTPQILD